MIRAISDDIRCKDPFLIFMRYPIGDETVDKIEAQAATLGWKNDPRFSNFRIQICDCDVSEDNIVSNIQVLEEIPLYETEESE